MSGKKESVKRERERPQAGEKLPHKERFNFLLILF